MTTETKTNNKADLVKDYMRHTTGTENHYQHWTNQLRYTDGVLYVADTCGAHWLVDAIASHQPEIIRKGGSAFQVWELTPYLDMWVLSGWTDTPHESSMLARQELEYTDFPDELMPLTLWVEGGVLLLPEEH